MQQLIQDQQYSKTVEFLQEVITKPSLPENVKIALGELYESLTKENAVQVYQSAESLCRSTWRAQSADFTIGVIKTGALVFVTGGAILGIGMYFKKDGRDWCDNLMVGGSIVALFGVCMVFAAGSC